MQTIENPHSQIIEINLEKIENYDELYDLAQREQFEQKNQQSKIIQNTLKNMKENAVKLSIERNILAQKITEKTNYIKNISQEIALLEQHAKILKETQTTFLNNLVYIDNNELSQMLTKEIIAFEKKINQYNHLHQKQFDELIDNIKKNIKQCLQNYSIDSNIYIYGSYATKLSLPSSDIDLIVEKQDWVEITKNIPNASIPILKVVCTKTYLQKKVDITLMDKKAGQPFTPESLQKQNLGMQCVDFVINLLKSYPLLRPMALVLKQFIYMQNLSDPYQGGLSSYALVLMIVAMYQYGQFGGYMENVGQFLLAFLQYYGHEMDYTHKMIYVCNIFAPGNQYQDKTYPNQKQPQFMPNLFIQDPLNPANNVGRPTYQIMKIKKSLFYAYFALNSIDKRNPLFFNQNKNHEQSNNFFIEEFYLLNKMCTLPKIIVETENFQENLGK